MCNYCNTENKILKDINSQNNKEVDWRGKKIDSLLLADSYKRLRSKKYIRVLHCGDFLEFKQFSDSSLKLHSANFCKTRLCPMCSWRRSLKIYGQASKVMDYVQEKYNYKYLFLTLTVRNCYGKDLKETIDELMRAFNKMNQRKVFKQSVKGYFRSLEVTYNRKRDDYHPHFHLILAVNKSYFDDSDYYISHAKWMDLWKSCLGVDYNPTVDIRRVKGGSGKDVSGKDIAEITKYTVKSADFLLKDEFGDIDEDVTDKVVYWLDYSLAYKRLTSFGFKFKEVHKLLSLDDVEDGDLIDTNNEDERIRDDLAYVILRYSWNIGFKNYILTSVEDGNVDVATGERIEINNEV